jgi:hypothetical protein
MDSATACE